MGTLKKLYGVTVVITARGGEDMEQTIAHAIEGALDDLRAIWGDMTSCVTVEKLATLDEEDDDE